MLQFWFSGQGWDICESTSHLARVHPEMSVKVRRARVETTQKTVLYIRPPDTEH